MRSCHLTQEQALEIAKQTLTLPTYTTALKGELQAFANAVLDQVLGEPVAEVEVRKNRILTDTLMQVTSPISDGRHKLYAPKGRAVGPSERAPGSSTDNGGKNDF